MIQAFKGYINQILFIALFVIIIELILPKGNIKKYVNAIISLLVLLVIISPVFKTLETGSINEMLSGVLETISSNTYVNTGEQDVKEFTKYKNSVITQSVKENIEKDVRDKLLKIEVYTEKVEIDVDDNYTFDKITVYIENLGLKSTKLTGKINAVINLISSEYKIDKQKISIIERGE